MLKVRRPLPSPPTLPARCPLTWLPVRVRDALRPSAAAGAWCQGRRPTGLVGSQPSCRRRRRDRSLTARVHGRKKSRSSGRRRPPHPHPRPRPCNGPGKVRPQEGAALGYVLLPGRPELAGALRVPELGIPPVPLRSPGGGRGEQVADFASASSEMGQTNLISTLSQKAEFGKGGHFRALP